MKTRKVTFNQLCEEVKSQPTKLEDFLAQVAKASNRQIGTVRMWMTGRQMPDINTIIPIAREFNCDPEILRLGFEKQCQMYNQRKNKSNEKNPI